jgi:two-component system, NtrC family, sensor histidine kinase HydH
MVIHNPPMRFVRPVVALTSLLLVGLCVVAAVSLFRQQTAATEALRKNLDKRRAAGDLEQSLRDLQALLETGVDNVGVINGRVETQLQGIRDNAGGSANLDKIDELIKSFGNYHVLWKQRDQPRVDRAEKITEAAAVLEETLRLSKDLVEADTEEIQRADADHRQSMRWLAWGMGGIGLMGAGAGLVFGYGVARALSRTIRRLQIRLLDAAGKLSPELPEIVLTGDGDLGRLEGQIQELMERLEQLVKKLQQREREVLRAEQMAAVGQLAAGVAHEIRNPLTSIKMLVQAGREESSGLVPEDLEVIEREALRMERSLQVFLDFARLPKPERSRQDIAAIAEQTLNLVRGRAAKQHVELKFVGPKNAVFAEVDGEQIRQVLVNLCLNALDVMPAGGTLELSVKPSDDQVELSVLDTGPGISAELMPRLFEPFVSTKETGLGLGLVISRRIVEEHHGQLNAANRIAGGASFTVELPVGQKERE